MSKTGVGSHSVYIASGSMINLEKKLDAKKRKKKRNK
jgi:hypothetical protein